MSKSVLIIDTPEDCRDCMVRDLTDRCQVTGKDVDEYRESRCRPRWCPLEEVQERCVERCTEYLKKHGYIVLKFTKDMEKDFKECEEMDENGKSKDCCGCSCSVCLVQ